jgi:hypothetical protein
MQYAIAVLLFIVLSPGLFLRIPAKGSQWTVVLVHTAVFAGLLYLVTVYGNPMPNIFEGFNQERPSITAILNNSDMAPLTVVATKTGDKSGTITLPASMDSIKPYSLIFGGNMLGQITFPPGISLPKGDYNISLNI